MKLDRPGLALLISFTLGGAVYVYGLEKAALGVFLVLVGLGLYSSLSRSLK